MNKETVLIHGSYYKRNFGDFLLLRTVVEHVKSVRPNASVVLPFADKAVLDEFKDIARGLALTDLFRAKLLIFSGGGYLGEPSARLGRWSIAFMWRHFAPFFILKKIFKIPLIIIGVGAGPASKPIVRWAIKQMLKASDASVFRDTESLEFALQLAGNSKGIDLGTDLAQDEKFLRALKNSKEQEGPYIGIHIGLQAKQNLIDLICERLSGYCQKGGRIVFFADSPGHNENLLQKKFQFSDLAEKFPEHVKFVPYDSAAKVIGIVDGATGIITGKLHVGIVACTLGVPVLSIPLHQKTRRYYWHIENQKACVLPEDSREESIFKIDEFFGFEKSSSALLPRKISDLHEATTSLMAKHIKIRLAS